MASKAHQFFFEHKIFTFEAFVHAMENPTPTCHAMLHQHLKSGNIVHIRQGLYASIPKGANPDSYPIDPYAIISVLDPNALIAYHSALQFRGFAYSFHFQHIFQSSKKMREFQFRQDRFKMTQYPASLPLSKRFIFSEEIDHHGFHLRVTDIERTLVDSMDRINLSGGLEEVWRSLNNIEKVELDKVIEYALLLNNATTIAKVGFYLRLRQKAWAVPESCFETLKKHLPKSVHYLDRQNRSQGKHIKEWRIIVPHELMGEQWEELLDMGEQ